MNQKNQLLRAKSLPPIETAAASLGDLKTRSASRKVNINRRNHTATLHFAYPYEIDLDGIRSEADLLGWLLHLCEKEWMDTVKLHEVATAIADAKGFRLQMASHPPGVTQDWPRVTVNAAPGEMREWVHDVPPRYYLHQPKEGEHAGKWVVIDRVFDLAVTQHFKTKGACVRAFVREYDKRKS